MTNEFIMENCTKCKDCYYIGHHMYGCRYRSYKGKWIAEIEKCPKFATVINVGRKSIDRLCKENENGWMD